MTSVLNVQIISPERVVRALDARFIVIPAFDGEIGILPGHAPLLAQLKAGVIRLHHDEIVEIFAVSGGFVTVSKNQVAILAETAEMAEEIDVERARQAAEKAKSLLRQPLDTKALAAAEASLKRALVRLQVSQGLQRNARSQIKIH